MIFGNPYKFAIHIDFVNEWFLEWGDDFKNEGVFHYIINGYIFPPELKSLSVDITQSINSLKSRANSLNKIDTSDIYNMPSQIVINNLEDILKKILEGDENMEEWQLYESTFLNIEENSIKNINSWLISNDLLEKILFMDYKNNIQEVILEKGYCKNVMQQAINWAEDYFK